MGQIVQVAGCVNPSLCRALVRNMRFCCCCSHGVSAHLPAPVTNAGHCWDHSDGRGLTGLYDRGRSSQALFGLLVLRQHREETKRPKTTMV
jgi:hypothetical protein